MYMIPHTKLRFYDEVHRVGDSQSNFHVVRFFFYVVLMEDEGIAKWAF